MNKIRDYPTDELIYGIARCNARLAGIMPMGILNRRTVECALKQYRDELLRRGEKDITDKIEQ
ncbi:MAG: hypothetical protein LBC19_04630 [Tannerella sp.]|jgi:hypothetical protein|nr:hypothetical protein [Tannerella sp.]